MTKIYGLSGVITRAENANLLIRDAAFLGYAAPLTERTGELPGSLLWFELVKPIGLCDTIQAGWSIVLRQRQEAMTPSKAGCFGKLVSLFAPTAFAALRTVAELSTQSSPMA